MAERELPQLYLITPSQVDLDVFPDRLAAILDAVEVACLRLSLASRDADEIARAADALRAVAHDRDVAIVIESHLKLVEPHGLDGVHLPNGAKSVRDARKALGADAIVGAFSGASRHDGLSAGEAGADYVAFGPVGATALGHAEQPSDDLFSWWSEVVEVPVVAEGGLTADLVRHLSPVTDFFGIGDEIWTTDDPAAALASLAAARG